MASNDNLVKVDSPRIHAKYSVKIREHFLNSTEHCFELYLKHNFGPWHFQFHHCTVINNSESLIDTDVCNFYDEITFRQRKQEDVREQRTNNKETYH